MRWMWKRAALVGAVGLFAGGAFGCAEERPPINRVQANALSKSFFVGDKLHDSSDDPEFWTQGTLIDVGYGASQDGLFTSTYAQPVSRIKWQITEDLLLGRLTYERIEDSDGKGAGAASNDGVISVAYKIESHFDIRREYNPTTGEETNVIVENTTDRPWYEREYMRVDWSQNLNTDSYDFDTLSMLGIYGGVTYESMAYDIRDKNDPNAPHFESDGSYFDITNKAFATPKLIDLSHLGWGIDKFPACYLDYDFFSGGAPAANCNPVELTIRQSFRRVVDKDYEPQDWDGWRFKAFGAFTSDRNGYARNYGMSDDKWHRFINRYNIWDRSHFYTDPANMTGHIECFTPTTTPPGCDPHRDGDTNCNGKIDTVDNEVADGTEDECAAAGSGSRCDAYKQRCTLPFRQRKAVTVPWYYTKESNPEYFDGTEWATHEWDVALRSAVMAAKNAECKATGGDPGACDNEFKVYHGQMDEEQDAVNLAREVDDCRNRKAYEGQNCTDLAHQIGSARGYDPGVIALAQMDEMIVLCHSPVQAGDHAACGPVGLTVRMGDLRYHQVNVITQPQTPSPWGIMVDSNDPLTGETIAGSINVWSHVNDLWSQGIVDQMRYLTGEVTTADVTEGTYVRDWAIASEAAQSGGALPQLTQAERTRRIAASIGVSADKIDSLYQNAQISDPNLAPALDSAAREVRTVRADSMAPTTTRAIYEARRKQAIGTEFEAELVTKAMQQRAGVDGLPMNDAMMEFASPLRGGNPMLQRDIRQLKEVALSNRGACIMQEAPPPLSVTALNKVVDEKFGDKYGAFGTGDKAQQLARATAVQKFLAQRAHYAVIIHEMGHSIGLRHNFVSSSDAWNFRPQYWQLRTRNGEITTQCADLKSEAESASCVGPRYFDAVTQEERDNLIWMFMQSSTMDYAGEATQDLLGLGQYDFAAARMFYGETVSVHQSDDYLRAKALGKASIDKMDGFGGILGFQYTSNGSTSIHYSQLQSKMKLIDPATCVEVDPQAFKPANWNEEREGKWHPLVDGLIVSVDGKYSRCKQQRVDYVPWQAMNHYEGQAESWDDKAAAYDKSNRTRVPYGFATDRWADLGNLAVYRHDNGADPYELFNFFITSQEVGHIWDNYRRHRQSFSVRSASERTLGRWNAKMRDGAKGVSLIVNIWKDIALEAGMNFDADWPAVIQQYNYTENILASGIAFDHFVRQTARPEPGPHFLPVGDDVLRSIVDTYIQPGPTAVTVPNGVTGYRMDSSPDGPAMIGIGGRPIENALAEDKGEYDAEYTVNCGSYYDKVFASMLMTESVDNFISDSRRDFTDARYRAVSLADLFPDGYRRWLANNLTGDDFIKGPRVTATAGKPDTVPGDPQKYPAEPIGWTSWWDPSGPKVCFPADGSLTCGTFGALPGPYEPKPIDLANTMPLDPQIGWEQQKFLIAWTMMYLPENQQQTWLNMLRIWQLGPESDPGFANRIEFHDPYGNVYVAKTFGKEDIFGKNVQKAIAARVLEYANQMLAKAYVVNDGPDLDGDMEPDWYIPELDQDGQPIVKHDPDMGSSPTCNGSQTDQCTCAANRSCILLERYVEVPFFLRQALWAYGLADPSMKGVYD